MSKPRETIHKSFDAFIVKAQKVSDTIGEVEAIVNTFGIIDKAVPPDIVHPGAFAKTLQDNFGRVKVLDNHRLESAKDAIGKPIEMREVLRDQLPESLLAKNPDATGGLYTKTQFMLNDPDSAAIYNRLEAGVLNEFSIGFEVVKSDWSKAIHPGTGKEVTVRNIRELRLWEYSVVIFGASETATLNVRNEQPEVAETPAPPETRELTPDGEYEVQRFGDMLWGAMYQRGVYFSSEMLIRGNFSMDEFNTVIDALTMARDVLRGAIPEELWMRAVDAWWAIQLSQDLKPDTKSDTLNTNKQVENDPPASEAEPPTEALTSTRDQDVINRLRLLKPD